MFIIFYPCLISNGSPDPKLWDQLLAGAHSPSVSICHGFPKTEHQVQRCQGIDTSQDAKICFFNMSAHTKMIKNPRPFH